MKEVTDIRRVYEFVVTHLPAFWVVVAAALGVATLTSLGERPALYEDAGARGAVAQSDQSFPLVIGIVERVIDGDTYDVRLERTGDEVRVRLAWMDAVEHAQPFGAEATQWAETVLLDRRVVLTVQDVNPYGRLVAQVSVEGDRHMWDVGATLARLGLGWVDPRYGNDHDSLREDQERARSEGVGLWAQANPMSPWEWRRIGKAVEFDDDVTTL